MHVNISDTELYDFIKELFPICRSITGNGVRATLNIVSNKIPLKIFEVPSGNKVFDWTIPEEWNISDAYIKDLKGNRIIDFNKSNLHVVNYSSPISRKIKIDELKKHLFSLPEKPELIPYKTTYYKKDWGFCLSHNQQKQLNEDEYEVCIDSSLHEGSLTYGEFFIEGENKKEVLISTHICHPSMCNDNLSGISIATYLAKFLLMKKRKYSYRIIFIPATIGAITWLSRNENKLQNIDYGLVISLLGDSGIFNYKKSRSGNSKIDKITEFVLKKSSERYNILEFEPYGYDERQFCSPGINLPMGRLTRTPNQEFPEYHTSGDNLDFISSDKLNQSYKLLIEIIDVIELNKKYINLSPKGEPQLGKRGIYNSVAGEIKQLELAMLWILNFSDGENDLVDIANRSEFPFSLITEAANILEKHNLIKLKNKL